LWLIKSWFRSSTDSYLEGISSLWPSRLEFIFFENHILFLSFQKKIKLRFYKIRWYIYGLFYWKIIWRKWAQWLKLFIEELKKLNPFDSCWRKVFMMKSLLHNYCFEQKHITISQKFNVFVLKKTIWNLLHTLWRILLKEYFFQWNYRILEFFLISIFQFKLEPISSLN
jgi:hypothetical protein